MTQFEKRLVCVIRADGTIARDYLIDTCEFDEINKYTISWEISRLTRSTSQLVRSS
jgi:hypothetical protein